MMKRRTFNTTQKRIVLEHLIEKVRERGVQVDVSVPDRHLEPLKRKENGPKITCIVCDGVRITKHNVCKFGKAVFDYVVETFHDVKKGADIEIGTFPEHLLRDVNVATPAVSVTWTPVFRCATPTASEYDPYTFNESVHTQICEC